MSNQNQPPAVIQSTAVNLLRDYYPSLTAESLDAALSQHGTASAVTVQKKLTRSECARILGVSINSVNRYIKSGRLKAVNISPRLVRIDPESVRNLLTNGVSEDEVIIPQCHGKAGDR
jgi:DNA-binding CsgD family transcriptional regulator